jgi:hypothetical protein
MSLTSDSSDHTRSRKAPLPESRLDPSICKRQLNDLHLEVSGHKPSEDGLPGYTLGASVFDRMPAPRHSTQTAPVDKDTARWKSISPEVWRHAERAMTRDGMPNISDILAPPSSNSCIPDIYRDDGERSKIHQTVRASEGGLKGRKERLKEYRTREESEAATRPQWEEQLILHRFHRMLYERGRPPPDPRYQIKPSGTSLFGGKSMTTMASGSTRFSTDTIEPGCESDKSGPPISPYVDARFHGPPSTASQSTKICIDLSRTEDTAGPGEIGCQPPSRKSIDTVLTNSGEGGSTRGFSARSELTLPTATLFPGGREAEVDAAMERPILGTESTWTKKPLDSLDTVDPPKLLTEQERHDAIFGSEMSSMGARDVVISGEEGKTTRTSMPRVYAPHSLFSKLPEYSESHQDHALDKLLTSFEPYHGHSMANRGTPVPRTWYDGTAGSSSGRFGAR